MTKVLLQIFVTNIPMTTATAERSFSSLRLHKDYTKSIMSEDRLNDLTVLNIRKNMSIDINEVINRLLKQIPRRMQMENWSK